MSKLVPNFHELFAQEAISDVLRYTCPPSQPATTMVSAEGQNNYATLQPNASTGFGMTALMAMETWESKCYGQVRLGHIFLFPGVNSSSLPSYQGSVRINCQSHNPLYQDGSGALHKQMCALLERPTTSFIGFSLTYPWNEVSGIGYNSGTCNPYWFAGSRSVSPNCNGVNWQKIISDTIAAWLPLKPYIKTVPLYIRWSGSRQDTRTQTCDNFESYYDGSPGLLGYIFVEQQPGTVPLYMRWSGSRKDTRTQVGDNFEFYYDGGQKLLGYIFAEQQPGTVPLYMRWSSSRQDTRTQVGDNFESYYDGPPGLLGYIIL